MGELPDDEWHCPDCYSEHIVEERAGMYCLECGWFEGMEEDDYVDG